MRNPICNNEQVAVGASPRISS